MVYETLLLIGIVGLAAQTVLGFAHGHGGHGSHGGQGNHGAHNGHAGHASTHAHGHSAGSHAHGQSVGHQAHGHGGHEHAGEHHESDSHTGGFAWLSLLSPLTLFSVCFGAGLTGLAVRGVLANPVWVAGAAAAGGAGFYSLVVRPISNLIFNFASRPAETLSGIVAQEAEATSRFDEQGRGIVRAVVDGEVVRLLAHLESDDRAKGVTVAPGEKVVVTSVDPQKNTVRVTRL